MNRSTPQGRLRMEWFSHVDKINLSNIGIFEFDFWKLKIDGRQCHLQPLMLINDANAIFCHCHPKWKLKITYDQPIKVHHPFSSQPIISLKLGNFLSFKKLPGKFIRSRRLSIDGMKIRVEGRGIFRLFGRAWQDCLMGHFWLNLPLMSTAGTSKIGANSCEMSESCSLYLYLYLTSEVQIAK